VIGWLPAQANLIWTRLLANVPASETVECWGHPRALKQAIDPRATFNPGRFYARL
jgi:FAD/FMN-containing dehydrogenase